MSELYAAAGAMFSNSLLRMLPDELQLAILRQGRVCAFRSGETIQHAHAAIGGLHWPLAGVLSIRQHVGDDDLIEVAMVGREGLTGAPALLACGHTPYRTVAVIAGEAIRIEVELFLSLIEQHPNVSGLLRRYAQTQFVQMAETAFACGRRTVVQRLARWLLMCFDRVDGDSLCITHDMLSSVLGVRRPGVTLATQDLEGSGSIRAKRGTIILRNRDLLEKAAGGCYGSERREYRRLLSPRGDKVEGGPDSTVLTALERSRSLAVLA